MKDLSQQIQEMQAELANLNATLENLEKNFPMDEQEKQKLLQDAKDGKLPKELQEAWQVAQDNAKRAGIERAERTKQSTEQKSYTQRRGALHI